jgi:hypothetical protein
VSVRELVESVCEAKCWSKSELARQLGVTHETVFRWCREGNPIIPRSDKVAKMQALVAGRVNRELYKRVGQLVLQQGVASFADIRESFGSTVTNDELKNALMALAEDGAIDFAGRV